MGNSSATREQDQQAILTHIHGIFDAFARQDQEALVRTHQPDFCGFTVRSRVTVHDRDQYVSEIQTQLKVSHYQNHELSDVVFNFQGDTVVVCYIALVAYPGVPGPSGRIKLRGLDVYARTPEGWNLLACNTSLHPDEIDRRLSAAVAASTETH